QQTVDDPQIELLVRAPAVDRPTRVRGLLQQYRIARVETPGAPVQRIVAEVDRIDLGRGDLQQVALDPVAKGRRDLQVADVADIDAPLAGLTNVPESRRAFDRLADDDVGQHLVL